MRKVILAVMFLAMAVLFGACTGKVVIVSFEQETEYGNNSMGQEMDNSPFTTETRQDARGDLDLAMEEAIEQIVEKAEAIKPIVKPDEDNDQQAGVDEGGSDTEGKQ